jgi:transcriptional regulator with XRE-family HTH domain
VTKPTPNPRGSLWNLIADHLRFFRTKEGLSGEELGLIIGGGKSEVSKIETGKERLTAAQAERLDKNRPTGNLWGHLVWFASIGHDPEWFPQKVSLEQEADFVRIYESRVVTGLLQTPDYAAALLAGGIEPNPQGALKERLERQGMLSRNPPPHLTAIMPQTALEWMIGSPEIMRAQLAHLLEMAEQPHIVVRVVPKDAGAYPGLNGSFDLLSGSEFGEVAYTEAPGSGRLVSSPDEVRTYGIRYERISAVALTAGRSRDLILKIMEAYE